MRSWFLHKKVTIYNFQATAKKKWEEYQIYLTFTFVWRCGWTIWDGSSSLLTLVDGTSTKLICMPLLKWLVSYSKKIKCDIKLNVQAAINLENEKKKKTLKIYISLEICSLRRMHRKFMTCFVFTSQISRWNTLGINF